MKQASAARRGHVSRHVCCSCALSDERHSLCVSTEGFDILPHPAHRKALVEEACVARRVVFGQRAQLTAAEPTKDAETCDARNEERCEPTSSKIRSQLAAARGRG
jgi:hypothetical protein